MTSQDYIKTTSHSYIARGTVLGAKQVEIKGRSIVQPGCVVDGEQGLVKIGRYCWIGSNTTIRPPPQPMKSSTSDSAASSTTIPITVGSHTRIGQDCLIQAAAIGSFCWIGDGVRLGNRVILKDCCVVQDGAHVSDDTVVPPFTRIASNNSSCCLDDGIELPPSVAQELQSRSEEAYQAFVLEQA